ncbi:hypothetical protein GYMLUDRAFT_207526 [Collybiopsis luxurians FD-317 M1]|uniref:Unplaced genomic scaffold GYMLUscaffold_83, whole genome shotgun sequence n=1 Tax=Collybiopsis luxurians FD-317 M1 TaxID=944289 RepID=A0A0D0BUQ0_9AGAR|nr:hypothetical protein GYMLUDRAFT_207526 [Collybiopsis luxurians FD-317 M1]
MSQPLYWLGKYFFYAIGNTPTISLTRDLSPRTPGNILLLGCGDPRNVLFTVFNEEPSSDRSLDITCSDFDPGIIARNALLLTMIMDKTIPSQTMWRIFFDMKINRDTYSVLSDHCRKLCQYSSSQKAWTESPYGSLIKFSTLKTLEEVHRLWQFYSELETLPSDRQKHIRDAFTNHIQEVHKMLGPNSNVISSARAAGPLMPWASSVYAEYMRHYSTVGVSFSRNAASATLINPTFAYSFVGEGCNVHYGTTPLAPFHSAALFGNATRTPSANDVVQAAQKQFGEWCDAFYVRASQPSRVTLRFAIAEATALCRAFCSLNANRNLQTGIPVSQWKASTLTFDAEQYSSPGDAPTYFNVIDTSNLVDYIGLLNILVSALPLRTGDGVIYTESLLSKEEDATKEFTLRLFADLGTMALLLGVAPVDFLSGFFSRSNTHELALQSASKHSSQFHEVTTWKSSTSLDVPVGASPPVIFDNVQLGTFLWDMYSRMFEEEDSRTFWTKRGENVKAIMSSDLIRYNRESFVLFLKLARSNLTLSDEDWESVMERFFSLQESDTSMPMDTVNRQDFHSQLYRHNVYTSPVYRQNLRRLGRFSEWSSVPQLVRIILVVPRSRMEDVFQGEEVGTPILQGDVRGSWSMNAFSSIHVGFGRTLATGTKASPRVVFEEDREGWRGRSPLVVSFTMPTQILVNLEPQSNLSVNLTIRSTGASTMMFVKKLGITLNVFSAKMLDETHVHILPESQFPIAQPTNARTPLPSNIGPTGPVAVTLDEECEIASLMTVRITVQNPDVIRSFGSEGAIPEVTQLSPCIVKVAVSNISQDIAFPYPVRGSDHRLRLARKSLYIELLVPPSRPFGSGGMRVRPFPVTTPSDSNPEALAWNFHHLNLSRLPVVVCTRPKELDKWLNPHLGSMLSVRERKLLKKQERDDLMFVKTSLHALMVRASGIQGGKARRLFSLMDGSTKNSDTIFFINELRYDQGAHTVVCDAFVLPLTIDFLRRNERNFTKLVNNGDMEHIKLEEGEVASWKHLIPAFVERCRTTWTHGENCEYKARGKIPLSEEIEHNPLCSCGQGKDVEGMSKVTWWRPFAPYVTRIALSPLFAVSYLDPVLRDINARRCWLCRGKGKPKLQECTGCKKVRYCGPVCQKKDWPVHKKKCTKRT